jgi:hypothetical protein
VSRVQVMNTICLLGQAYKPGSQPPDGYNAWQEWAKIQYRAGLRQARCPTCKLCRFPQEKCCREVLT